jgi:hypothetical protein
MRANLFPHLDDLFFLRYCLVPAIASYLMIAWQLRKRLGGRRLDLDNLDIVDSKVRRRAVPAGDAATVR